MAILAAVLAVSAPALGRFFRGRNLDAEAHRLLALTRHAQDRAVSEGIPMVLWIDLNQRRYGLMAEPSWSLAPSGSRGGAIQSLALESPEVMRLVRQDDPRAVDFDLAEDLEFEVETAVAQQTRGSLEIRENPVVSRPLLRFQPDGFLPVQGPRWIELRHRQKDSGPVEESKLWIAPGENRIAYAIWTNQPPIDRW